MDRNLHKKLGAPWELGPQKKKIAAVWELMHWRIDALEIGVHVEIDRHGN